MRVLGWWAVRWFLGLVIATSTASAQPAPPEPPTPPTGEQAAPEPAPTPAVTAFRAGRDLLDAGQFEAACAKFTESIGLDPDAPGTLLNLGLCNEKLGKTATALAWFRRGQYRSAEAQMGEYEQAAKEHAVVLAARVATLRVDAAPGVTVKVDGATLSETERARVELDPGTHVIEAGTEHREITVHDGDKQELTLKTEAPKHYVMVDRGVKQRHYAYYAVGTGAALYLASASLSLVGRSRYHDSDHPETYQRWQGIVRYGGTSLFLVGSAAVVGGVYLYVKAPKRERIEQVAPIVARDQLGVAIAGSF